MIVQSNVKSPCWIVLFLLKMATTEIVPSNNGVFPDQVIAELNKMLPKYTLTAFRQTDVITTAATLRSTQPVHELEDA